MGLLILVITLLFPIAEIYVIVLLSKTIGVEFALTALVGASLLGVLIFRWRGPVVWQRFTRAVQQDNKPGRSATSGLLFMLGCAMLIAPGLISGVIGLLLLLPIMRWLLSVVFGRILSHHFMRRVAQRPPPWVQQDYDVEGTAHEVPQSELEDHNRPDN